MLAVQMILIIAPPPHSHFRFPYKVRRGHNPDTDGPPGPGQTCQDSAGARSVRYRRFVRTRHRKFVSQVSKRTPPFSMYQRTRLWTTEENLGRLLSPQVHRRPPKHPDETQSVPARNVSKAKLSTRVPPFCRLPGVFDHRS